MVKYIRKHPSQIRKAPAHRFTSYIHYFNEPSTPEHYFEQFTDDNMHEAREALAFLLINDLIEVIDKS